MCLLLVRHYVCHTHIVFRLNYSVFDFICSLFFRIWAVR